MNYVRFDSNQGSYDSSQGLNFEQNFSSGQFNSSYEPVIRITGLNLIKKSHLWWA